MNVTWNFSQSQTSQVKSSFDEVLALGAGPHVGIAASLEWAIGAVCSFNIETHGGRLFDEHHVPAVPILLVLSAFSRATARVREGEPLVVQITDELRIHFFGSGELVAAYDFEERDAIKASRGEWATAWRDLESQVSAFLQAEVPNLSQNRVLGAWIRGEDELPPLLEPGAWEPSLDGPLPRRVG